MNKSETNQKLRGWLKAALLLVVILVAVTSAAKDLEHLKELTSGLGSWGSSLASTGMTPVYASSLSRAELARLEVPAQTDDQFRWTGRVEQGKSAPSRRAVINSKLPQPRARGAAIHPR